MEAFSFTEQRIGGGVTVCTSRAHTFGTDALLLADFAAPRTKDVACDLGTGCGIIPLYWASRKRTAETWGLDIQPQAVEQFRQGIARSRAVEGNLPLLVPLLGDLRYLPPALSQGRFDLVSCNPPYQAGQGYRPALPAEQIARHEVLCNSGDVCKAAARLLRYGGTFCLCQRPERLTDILCAMRAAGLEPKALRFVAKEEGNIPWLFLLRGKKGAKPGIRVLPPLPIYKDGGYSQELRRIYASGPASQQ